MARFTIPRNLYYGRGALEHLKDFHGTRAVICVGHNSMKKTGVLAKVITYLEEAGMKTEIIDDVEQDPSVQTVLSGAKRMLDFQPDWIFGVGGGSSIDAAKAMWIKYEYPNIDFSKLCEETQRIPELRKKAKFCAISSTGASSEVSSYSDISDYTKGIKYAISDFEITPDVAIIDATMSENLTQLLIAHSGMDALTHAIEAYVANERNDFADAVALHAIRLIERDLVASYRNEKDKRLSMHNAQTMAGIAVSNSMLGLVHAIANKIGTAFSDLGANIAHGAATAIILPKVISFNSTTPIAMERYAEIADVMHLGGITMEEKINKLIRHIRLMSRDLDLPLCFKEYAEDGLSSDIGFIEEIDFENRKDTIATNILYDPILKSNPRQPSHSEILQLLDCCYYDLDVDFQTPRLS